MLKGRKCELEMKKYFSLFDFLVFTEGFDNETIQKYFLKLTFEFHALNQGKSPGAYRWKSRSRELWWEHEDQARYCDVHRSAVPNWEYQQQQRTYRTGKKLTV